MNKKLRRILGHILIYIGILGLFLPILEGVGLIILGFFLLQQDKVDRLIIMINKWTQKW